MWTQGERFGTIGAQRTRPDGTPRTLEITTFRSEAYADESRKPHVTFADEVEVDLGRRDFTVNAMALELVGDGADATLVDPYGGAADLATGTLRTPLAPEISFDDDPLRMLRAARFIAGFGLQPVPELVAAVVERRERLAIVSAERIRDELDKLIVVDRPSAGLWFLVDTGLAEHFLPELPALRLEHDPIHRHKDVLSHTIAVVENVTPLHRRLRLPHHPPGRAVPRHRQAAHAWLPAGQGHHVPPPRRRRGAHDAPADGGAALPDGGHRRRVRAGVPAPALPHLQDGMDATRRCAATCATPASCSPSSTC